MQQISGMAGMGYRKMVDRHVTVAGSGVAGLSAAVQLAGFGIEVLVVEQSPFAGGHAVGYACKATDACVKCGACMVETLLAKARQHPRIHLKTDSRLENINAGDRLTIGIAVSPQFVDPGKCDSCGLCFDKCPAGAVIQGSSSHHVPFYALKAEACMRPSSGETCSVCRDACPQNAIALDAKKTEEKIETDALVFATGFNAYDPRQKPYGYGLFENVITNLDLEREMRKTGRALCPSDGREPSRVAFIQCVGSRDASLNHLWCSQVCCGSALRLGRLIKARQPATDITVFYIDIQRFGKDFETFYRTIHDEIEFVRSIPGDVFENEDRTLTLGYMDDAGNTPKEAAFDLLVLSVGLLPNPDAAGMAAGLGMTVDSGGFVNPPGLDRSPPAPGVFAAGTATGPMSIPDAIASGGQAAAAVLSYLK
ncbi:MAG: FAD-dependent oxidoreductase [Deltaproteobacteria bacterium]|nr:FAD-dependent oxidoreductase [Deltaproteobacteria bacterium]